MKETKKQHSTWNNTFLAAAKADIHVLLDRTVLKLILKWTFAQHILNVGYFRLCLRQSPHEQRRVSYKRLREFFEQNARWFRRWCCWTPNKQIPGRRCRAMLRQMDCSKPSMTMKTPSLFEKRPQLFTKMKKPPSSFDLRLANCLNKNKNKNIHTLSMAMCVCFYFNSVFL